MSKSSRRVFSVFLAIIMVLSMGVQAFADTPKEGRELELEDLDPSSLGIKKLGATDEAKEPLAGESHDLDDIVRVSIFLSSKATLDAGYAAKGVGTNAAAISYRDSVKRQQADVASAIEQRLGKALDVKWNLTLLMNVISANVRFGDIYKIKLVPGVKDVQLERLYEPQDGEASPNTANTSSFMVGASQAWSAGYTGAGSRLAIIDTGLDTSHQSFNADAFNYSIGKLSYTPDLMTSSFVSSVLSQLNGKGKYVSAKVPFAYNYVDGNTTSLDHSDGKGNHGSHVAGIAAANRYIKSGSSYVESANAVHAVGMAPDAQLVVMKVFGSGGGAYDSDYMAALEDAIVLGCDAANLSLGSAVQGFTFANSYQSVMNKLAGAENPDMLVSISAGNSYGITQFLETDLYIDDVSMHTGGSPGTYVNSMGVASIDNTGATGAPMIFNGSQTVFYSEVSEAANASSVSSVAGSYSYVYIDSIGDSASLSAVNSAASLSGKVVIVDRGSINFSEKATNAASYSPKAIIIANNESGALGASVSGYTGKVPVGTVSLEDALLIKEGSTRKTTGSYSYYTGTVQITSTTTHGQVSAREDAKVSVFSSWGVPGSLLLKPEISAPGGDIYSVNGYSTASDENVKDHTSYVSYSGTSMAAPHVTGLTGVLAEYLDRNDISVKNSALASKYSRRAIMQSLLMSTATPMKNSGQYVSLLQQGAGLVEVSRAIGAYSVVMMGENDSTLTAKTGAASDGKIKAELGDDPQRNGIYNYSFTIYNTSGRDLEFELSTDLFTQANYTEDGSVFMDQTTTGIDASVSYNWDGTVVVSGHDVDKDGDTDTDDVQAVLDYIVGNGGADRYPGGLDLSAAEMDGKSGISSLDAYMLLSEIENASAKDGVVAAGSSRTVGVTIRLTDAQKRALEQTYTSGAYIEGFTYITCSTTDPEGRDYSHQHSIPVLGFFGSWTDPSMFDNTSYTDSLYGTEKTPYTGHSDTNYLTVRYNGTLSKFVGNPYMAESSFPADRLAVNSNSAMGSISYNLIRSAGTTGFAVSKLDRVGGNVTDVISASVTGNEVDGIWYNQSSSSWQNLGTKSYSINKSAAAFGLKEGDVFRIGFYAVPEYNAMAVNGDYSSESAGILSQAGFRNLLKANVLGRGAFIGYDFTVDNTEPVINSAVLNSNTLTVTAGDDRSLAYVAVLSLDGNTVYSKAAPAAASYSVSIDVSNAVANAKGYVAVFAADYAGNEAAKAVKVNNNTSEDPYTVSSITLVPSSLDLYKGKTADISANVMPLTASDRSVSWTSSNTSVASVDANGHVTAVGAGSATITATSVSNSSVKASCSVKVTSVDKNLNAIIWDEEGGVYFSTFNTGSLPAWTKNHTEAKTEELVSAFMYNTSDLYAATLDANAQESVIYTVDRSSYALTEYGTNYVLATDMAVGPSNSSSQRKIGLVYVFGPYLVAGPLTPGDDGEGGTYCGIPQALLDCEETLDGAYLAAIACRSRSTTSSSYYVLDENGIIWQTTLSYNTLSSRFSTPTKVMETGISTSFMYQNLYYDGTYLYWTHTDGDTAELIIINPSSKAIYHAGDFGESVWPVGGMYVNGSVAPAAAGDELLDAEAEPEAQDAEALRPVMSRSELMSDKIMARFAAEAARSGRNRPAGGLNSISAVMKGRSHASVNGAGMTETDNGDGTVTVDVRYTETADASNGVVELSYDPEKLTFKGLGQDSASTFYALNDSEPGTVKLSYALTEAVAAGDTIFTFEFEASCSAAEIALETLEKNEILDIEGEVETIEIPEGHEWSDPVWNWTGYTSAVAVFTCGKDKTHVEEVEATITSVKVDPTPAEDGNITYTATAVGPDGNTYTDTRVEILPATGYTYKDPVYTWTKTEDGYTVTAIKECNEDPKQNITETVKATYSVTKPATCTEAGTGLYTAAFGNKAFEVQRLEVEIPALGHSWDAPVWTWTGYTSAVAEFTCSRDKTHVETFNANIASVTVDPTPTTNGSVTYTATVTGPDGKTYTDTKVEVLPATGYTYKDPVYTWNKTEDGYTVTALKECNEDPKQNITETVKATYSVTKPATCTEAGTGLYIAAFGNKAFEVQTLEVEIPATGHSWDAPVWTWTGYTSAVAKFTCSRDKTHIETVTATITSVKVDPTPAEDGSITYTATAVGPDGKTYTDTKVEVLPATGYTYKDPVYTWNKTEDGYTVTALKECNEDPKQNITETVKATYSVTKPATCTEAGTGLYTAAFGNKAFEVQRLEVEIPATGHSWTFSGFEWPTGETGSIFIGQKAIFRCGGCGQIMEVAAKQSYNNYAVTVSVSAEESPDGLAHSESKRAVQLDGVSLELADKISVRYKLHAPEFADHAEIYFEADRDTSGNAYAAPWKTITLDPSDSTYYDAAKGQFVIAFPEITSREMMDHVRLVVYDKDGQPLDIYRTTKQALYAGKIDYCAADWCGDVFARYGEDASHKSVRMAMAVLNFGAEAQKYFDDYNSDRPANPKGYLAAEMAAFEPDAANSIEGDVKAAKENGYSGMSLELAESTSIRLKFEEDLDVSVDGKPAALVPAEGRYMAVIGNLRSIDLTTMHSVSFTGTDGTERELVMCALSWCNAVFDSFGTDDSVQTVRLAKAVYLYSQAAENYFK